jgi:2-methylcitrate dehydratase PrpD
MTEAIPPESLARNLARKVFELGFDSLPGDVVRRAKEVLLDTIGVTLAGCRSDSADILNNFVDFVGGCEQSGILGRGKRSSAPNAALVNAATGHVLDFDDVSWSCIGHPAVVTVFPALALGEIRNASGREVITAFVAGYEVMSCLGRGLVPSFNERGWHSTATLGCFGAAATAAKILGCDIQETALSLGMASSLAAGIKGNMGTMTKHLQVGRAASAGVTAALLAKNGFTSSEKAIEGKDGFLRVFNGACDVEVMERSFGAPFDLVDGGAIFKKWPSCYSTHTCIEAVTALAEEHDIRPDQVEKIAISGTPLVVDVLFYDAPRTGFEAKFSDHFSAAVSIVRRKASIAEFSDEVVNDPVIRALMKKVELSVDPDLAREGYALSSAEGPTRTRVRVTLKDGRSLFREVAIAKGAPQRRLSHAELVEKYSDCAGPVLGKGGVDRTLDRILSLEKLDSISSLAEMLRT